MAAVRNPRIGLLHVIKGAENVVKNCIMRWVQFEAVAGVERVIFLLPSAEPAEVLKAMDERARLIR